MPSTWSDGSIAAADRQRGIEPACHAPAIGFAVRSTYGSCAGSADQSHTRVLLNPAAPARSTVRSVAGGETRNVAGTPRTAFVSEASICPSRFGTQASGAGVTFG